MISSANQGTQLFPPGEKVAQFHGLAAGLATLTTVTDDEQFAQWSYMNSNMKCNFTEYPRCVIIDPNLETTKLSFVFLHFSNNYPSIDLTILYCSLSIPFISWVFSFVNFVRTHRFMKYEVFNSVNFVRNFMNKSSAKQMILCDSKSVNLQKCWLLAIYTH